MSLIASEKSGWTIELIPEGVHIARCVSVIDLGTQLTTFEKKEKEVHQVRFEFEFPNLTYTFEDKDTKVEKTVTKVMGTTFSVSLNSKAKMRKFLESWRGKKFTEEELKWFNLWKVLWQVCQIQIIHSEDGKYANIENALPLMKWISVPETDRELMTFSILEDTKGKPIWFNEDSFEKLPEWLQNKIMESKEMKVITWNFSLDEQEEKLEEEVKTVSTKEAEAVFEEENMTEEPKSVTEARAKAKATPPADEDFFGEE